MAGKMVPAWTVDLYKELGEIKGELGGRLTGIETSLKQVARPSSFKITLRVPALSARSGHPEP